MDRRTRKDGKERNEMKTRKREEAGEETYRILSRQRVRGRNSGTEESETMERERIKKRG